MKEKTGEGMNLNIIFSYIDTDFKKLYEKRLLFFRVQKHSDCFVCG